MPHTRQHESHSPRGRVGRRNAAAAARAAIRERTETRAVQRDGSTTSNIGPVPALARDCSGPAAGTILRAAKLRPGQTALVIGATTETGTILMPLLAETGAHVIDSTTDRIDHTTADPVTDALRAHPNPDLLVDLVSWGEPYFITRAARHGTIVSAQPRPDGPSLPRIRVTAETQDLAALAPLALDKRQLVGVGC